MAGKFMMKTKSGSWLRFCIGSSIFLLCLGKAVSYVEPVLSELVRGYFNQAELEENRHANKK